MALLPMLRVPCNFLFSKLLLKTHSMAPEALEALLPGAGNQPGIDVGGGILYFHPTNVEGALQFLFCKLLLKMYVRNRKKTSIIANFI